MTAATGLMSGILTVPAAFYVHALWALWRARRGHDDRKQSLAEDRFDRLATEYEQAFGRPVPIGRTTGELRRILLLRKLEGECHRVRQISDKGVAAYGSERWRASCDSMERSGLNTAEFVEELVTAAGIDRTHEVFHALAGESPRLAALLAKMPPKRRAAILDDLVRELVGRLYPDERKAPS